jgi:hypothetical protein
VALDPQRHAVPVRRRQGRDLRWYQHLHLLLVESLMKRALQASPIALGLAVCAIALAASHLTWSLSLDVLAWTLLGVTAGYSLSGSV